MHKPPRVSAGSPRGKSAAPGASASVSLACCSPIPVLWRAPIPGTHSRLLLASDGLWDVISHAQACKLVRGAATAQRAADLLLGMAKRISNEKRGRTVEKVTWSCRRYTEDTPRRRLCTSRPNGRPACGRPPSRARAWARLCSPVRLGHGMVRQARRRACMRAWHVWRGTPQPQPDGPTAPLTPP